MFALLFCELFMSAGCDKKSCRPGEQVRCDCPGGGDKGVQVCSRDGSRFDSCDCPRPNSSNGVSDPTASARSPTPEPSPETVELERRKEELQRQLREAQEQAASSRMPSPPSSGKCGCSKTDPLCDCL